MALGEEKAEVEASVDTEAQSYRRWSCGEREVDTPGPAHGEQHPRLEAEGGPTSPVSGAEGLPAPTCLSGASQPHANDTNSELVADGSKPALQSLPPPPSMLTGDLLHCVGSQMETKLPASKELPQTPNVPRTALCSGHEADIEDDPSPVDSPRALDLSQPPRISGEGSLCSSQARRPSSGLLKTRPSLPAVSDRWPFSDPDAEEQLPKRAGGQGNASLVQCVQTFCCQLEELIHWLCTLADVTDQGTPLRPNLTGLKSSLQLYRQFKKDIDEHQTLTESVLQKGEILLQCLLDNTPVLKDVLGRIAKQSGELESHADRLYDSILSSLDTLAGCTLIPDSKPVAAKERPCERL
ncbi:centrosomal protein of 68 kDa isoform X2 [Tupaia chinensis]|uniref:centrosomal protein of 68 kDa isoform X2 n=1 Tax=Tupaia chinensis TaxID=246437 RepID=UPI0003C91C8E|nr:centrosomal protein of 68 kDa isoform X2 [Tupaia chinensis]